MTKPNWLHNFGGDDHEIISMVILPVLPIQEGQLSLAKVCAQVLINSFED